MDINARCTPPVPTFTPITVTLVFNTPQEAEFFEQMLARDIVVPKASYSNDHDRRTAMATFMQCIHSVYTKVKYHRETDVSVTVV
jgi:hypothetical protein